MERYKRSWRYPGSRSGDSYVGILWVSKGRRWGFECEEKSGDGRREGKGGVLEGAWNCGGVSGNVNGRPGDVLVERIFG